MLCTLLASVAMAPAPALLRLPVKLTILFEEILEDIHPTPSRTRYRIGTYEKDKLTVRKTITVDFLGGWSNGRLSPDGKEILVRASEWHHKPGTLYIIDVQQAKARLLDEARSLARTLASKFAP